jgi:hypothetical protein
MARRRDLTAHVAVSLALAGALAGCIGGNSTAPAVTPGASTPAPSGGLASASPAPSLATASGSSTPEATESAVLSSMPAAPPAASLSGLSGGAASAGSLGTYTWGGGGSDSPWIVGKRAGSVGVGATVTAAFAGLAPQGWTAAWAKVSNGMAGSPVGATSGAAAVTLTAPASGGDWTLRVTADFGPGSSATYYWRITVTP